MQRTPSSGRPLSDWESARFTTIVAELSRFESRRSPVLTADRWRDLLLTWWSRQTSGPRLS
jgi:hypothetical protein